MPKLFFIGLKQGFQDFGHFVTTIINSILLTVVYFIAVGLTSIIAKIFKKEFLDIKKKKNVSSYWKDLDLKKKPTKEYYRQF